MNIFLDIETIKAEQVDDKYLKLDSRLKDPEKIAIAQQNALEKTVFDGAFGECVSIAWAIDDYSVVGVGRRTEDEADFLKIALDMLQSHVFKRATQVGIAEYRKTWIGHNIAFDLGFLFKRCAVLGVNSPIRIPWPVNPWDRNIKDTAYMWEGRQHTVSLDKLSHVLLGEGKETGGSEVAKMWVNKQYDDILKYNMDDVRKTRDVFKNMENVNGSQETE